MNYDGKVDLLVDECGGEQVKGKPGEVSFDCPECGKADKHFRFNVVKDRGACWKCDYRVGSIEALIVKIKGISKQRAENWVLTGSADTTRAQSALEILNKAEVESEIVFDDKHVNSELPEEFIPMYDNIRQPVCMVPKVFAQRNYSLETIGRLGLGFCKEGKYAGRIIFPLRCDGQESFFARRIFDYQNPKYKNPPNSKHSQLLYNYDEIPNSAFRVFVVEGCTDVCRLVDWGYDAVGTSGKKISTNQIDLLAKKYPAEVVVLFDGDAIKENEKAFTKLSYRLNASIAFLPEKGVNEKGDTIYYDPDDAPVEMLDKAIENRVPMSRLGYAITLLNKI